MPLYEYECESCGIRFEKILKFSDPPIETCEKCGSRVRKLLSSPAIQFKGSGWYITDYAKKSSADAGKTSSGDAASGETSGEKKSDSGSSDSSAPAAASGDKTPAKS